MISPVELLYISCKNLAEVQHIRHCRHESASILHSRRNLSDSDRPDTSGDSDVSCKSRHFLQDS